MSGRPSSFYSPPEPVPLPTPIFDVRNTMPEPDRSLQDVDLSGPSPVVTGSRRMSIVDASSHVDLVPTHLPPGASPAHLPPYNYQPLDGERSPTTSLNGSRAATPFRDVLVPPRPQFIPDRQSVASNLNGSFTGSSGPPSLMQDRPLIHKPEAFDFQEKEDPIAKSAKRNSRMRILLLAAVGLVVLAAAIGLGVYFGAVRPKSNKTDSKSGSTASPTGTHTAAAPHPTGGIVYGVDGTLVTTETGSTFVYNNSFGGYFVQDPKNPFNNGAKAQSWTPALNETWTFGVDKIYGVNLGGWLVIEPFITPAFFQKYTDAVDEWTLSTAMAADTASGGISQLENHYKTFITEEDFAQIAAAGLNWVRLPIPFWAIDVWAGEPFLARTAWTYALKAFEWARKYGIRIALDLHTAPGSQNGYNHSGQVGKINLLNGVMGVANAQRLLHYIRIYTEFISQPQYKDVILMFGIINEPVGQPQQAMASFYLEAHNMIRQITGVGAGKGPYISIHDNFQLGAAIWNGFLTGSDRIALEPHPYFAFSGTSAASAAPFAAEACTSWADSMNSSQTTFGFTSAGEWSLGFNDCGLFLHTPADEHDTSATICAQWNQWETYTTAMKTDLMNFALGSMDALQHWFFWTWKIGPSSVDNSPRAPLWSYKLGYDNGWMPKSPRQAIGQCAALGVGPDAPFDGTYLPYQTGGGSGTINAAASALYGTWPPVSIGGEANAALLPTYTPTGVIPTLPPVTFAAPTPTVDAGDGWFNDADTALAMTTVAGCVYPNAWNAEAVAVPPLCTGAARRDVAPEPMMTPAP